MAESEQVRSDKDIILDARVTVYLDGLIISRLQNDIGQAGILTTLNDHCLRILIRGKGQLGHVWPRRDSSGNIPHIPYSSLKRMLALWLYVVPLMDSPRPVGAAGKLTRDPNYTFDGVLDFARLHDNTTLANNVLAPLKIPEGRFYMAQKTKFYFWQGTNDTHKEEREYSSLTGVAIDYELTKKAYLILEPELPMGSENPEPILLPARIPLEPGARYEVIVQNAPTVESYPPYHSMHFKEFYASLPNVAANERCNLRLYHMPEPPERDALGPRAYPNSPPCTSANYSGPSNFVWVPDGAGHH